MVALGWIQWPHHGGFWLVATPGRANRRADGSTGARCRSLPRVPTASAECTLVSPSRLGGQEPDADEDKHQGDDLADGQGLAKGEIGEGDADGGGESEGDRLDS